MLLERGSRTTRRVAHLPGGAVKNQGAKGKVAGMLSDQISDEASQTFIERAVVTVEPGAPAFVGDVESIK